jgi:hypothetical protein
MIILRQFIITGDTSYHILKQEYQILCLHKAAYIDMIAPGAIAWGVIINVYF